MKILLIFNALLLSTFISFAQTGKQFNIGTIDTLHTEVLGENRQLLIYTPPGISRGTKSKASYPVMYLLDGSSFFHAFTGMVQYLSSSGNMPQMIVVGIANTNRTRDLTPTHSVYWSDGEKDERALGSSGGGEKFISFIQTELIPYIEANYPTAPYRMLVGHSLGGLTTLNALINHPALFTAYVAIDPSVWWDHRSLMKMAGDVLSKPAYSGKQLFYASANTMDRRMDTVRVMNDTANANVHVRDNLVFRSILQKQPAGHLHWQWKYYPEDNHPSVAMVAGYDALRYFFKGFEWPKEMNDPTLTADDLRNHYKHVSEILGYQVLPVEGAVNALGYGNLEEKNFVKAYSFFKLNIENYPDSFNVYDSMSDYYIAIKKQKEAMSMLRKALALKDNATTRKKLNELQTNLK